MGDVVVRSFRALGIDLQRLVHEDMKRNFPRYPKIWGLSRPDTNIDHRRVNVLRRFFAREGRSLPVTKNPADYKPGDIVTMHLPEGRSSKTHIAIVTHLKSSAGVPLIVHNRGYGVQLEDWLFARRITGHYRYPR